MAKKTHLLTASITAFVLVLQSSGIAPAFAQDAGSAPSAAVALRHMKLSQFFPELVTGKSDFTPEETALFEDHVNQVVSEMADAGVLREDEFHSWWKTNRSQILKILSTEKWGDKTLEELVALSWAQACLEKSDEKGDAEYFIDRVIKPFSSPKVVAAFGIAAAAVGGFVGFAGGVIKGAFIAGPAGGVVSASVETLVRPIREWAGVKGAKLLNHPAHWLGSRLAATGGGGGKKEKINREEIQTILQEMKRTDWGKLSSKQKQAALYRFTRRWVELNQIWNTTFLPFQRDGRSFYNDAFIFRPQLFSDMVSTAKYQYDQDHEFVQKNVEKLKAQGAKEADLQRYLDLNADEFLGGDTRKSAAEMARLKAELHKAGVHADLLDQTVYHNNSMFTSNLRAQELLLMWNQHDLNYLEYTDALPPEMRAELRERKARLGFDSYQRNLVPRLQRQINDASDRLEKIHPTLVSPENCEEDFARIPVGDLK